MNQGIGYPSAFLEPRAWRIAAFFQMKDTCFLSDESHHHSVSKWDAILQLKMDKEYETVVCLHVQMVTGAKQLL